MITVRRHSFQNRKREDDTSYTNIDDPIEALLKIASLLRDGGVASGHRGRIRVENILGNRTDKTYFKGDKDSMKVLWNFVHLYDENIEDRPKLIIHPELMPYILSSNRSRRMKVAALIACGVNCPIEVQAHKHRNVEDLIAAAGLFRNGECDSLSAAFETLVA